MLFLATVETSTCSKHPVLRILVTWKPSHMFPVPVTTCACSLCGAASSDQGKPGLLSTPYCILPQPAGLFEEAICHMVRFHSRSFLGNM
jgi:hypothetical protein